MAWAAQLSKITKIIGSSVKYPMRNTLLSTNVQKVGVPSGRERLVDDDLGGNQQLLQSASVGGIMGSTKKDERGEHCLGE